MQLHKGELYGLKIVAYNDAKGFGGHEIQTLKAYHCLLAEGCQVTCFYRPSNERWAQVLKPLTSQENFTLQTVDLPHVRFHRPYHLFNPGTTNAIAEQFRALKPDIVFTSQGNLEISAMGAIAAKKANIPCLSYIPMSHSFTELKANKPFLRDLFNTYLATIPTRWLTISEGMKTRLRQRGAKQAIDIMPNAIDGLRPTSRSDARQSLGIPEDATVLGIIGRIEPAQKGSDVFLESLKRLPDSHPLQQAYILILGDGSGAEPMVHELQSLGWGDRVTWQPWSDAPETIYQAFDLIVMPSNFEGVPLVMLEALDMGIPMATSNVDGLGECLPQAWTCPPRNPDALCQLLMAFSDDPVTYLKPLPERQNWVRRAHNIGAFEAALKKSVKALLGENDVAEKRLSAKS